MTTATSSSTEANVESANIGNPDCPLCHGVGYIRKDVPITDPDFGKIQICSCRLQDVKTAERSRLFRLSNLEPFKNMTFESFKPQGRVGLGEAQVASIKTAYSQAVRFAQELNGWLLLLGTYGCGKTHLAAAIANYAVENGISTLFETVPDLLDWARFGYSNSDSSFEARFDEIRNIKLLVLDDLGTENTTPWAREKLYQIINYRYVNKLPTVITTNLGLEKIEERVRSRLQDDLVLKINITAPDYRNAKEDLSHPQLSSLHLHQESTFGNFSLRESEKLNRDEKPSLEKAFKAARDFAEYPSGWLVLMGGYGCGKTHLAAAIGNYRLSMGESPMFVVVPDLLDHLRATFSPNSSTSYDNLFQQVRTASLLILDDLGTQSATPWAREKLYQIFNYRYSAKIPTVITTSSEMKDIDARIRSRMTDARLCKVYAIMVPSYRANK